VLGNSWRAHMVLQPPSVLEDRGMHAVPATTGEEDERYMNPQEERQEFWREGKNMTLGFVTPYVRKIEENSTI
jgi:hypothetical protein